MDLRSYAFYSRVQESCILEHMGFNPKNSRKTITNFYTLDGTDSEVEVTEVCLVENNDEDEAVQEHRSRFSDSKYLGIVDKWVRVCKQI